MNVFNGHHNSITNVAWHPDGQTFASGCAYGSIRIWSPLEPELRHLCKGHEKEVTCLAYSPDGRVLASGSKDGTIRLWQLRQVWSGN